MKYQILISPNAAHEEVVDSIADVFDVAIVIGEALGDGFQWLPDIIAIASKEKEIREVINDFPIFLDQFLQLTPETALSAVGEARIKTEAKHGELPKAATFAFGILFNLASSYSYTLHTVEGGKQQVENWKNLFASIRPEEPRQSR